MDYQAVKQSFINRIALCDKCGKAFTIYEEGNESTCDSCIAENELKQELIDDGTLESLNVSS